MLKELRAEPVTAAIPVVVRSAGATPGVVRERRLGGSGDHRLGLCAESGPSGHGARPPRAARGPVIAPDTFPLTWREGRIVMEARIRAVG